MATVTARSTGFVPDPIDPIDQANRYAVEDVSFYEKLTAQRWRQAVGLIDKSLTSNKNTSFDDCLLKMKNIAFVPANKLGRVWLSASWKETSLTEKGNVFAEFDRPDYQSWDSYMYDLANENNVEQFLSKLLLHEAAGLCIDAALPPDRSAAYKVSPPGPVLFDAVTKLPYNLRLYDFEGSDKTPGSWSRANPFYGVNWSMQKYNRERHPILWVNDSNTILNEIGLATYKGYNPFKLQDFTVEVLRFHERVLSAILKESFFALDVARLEDETAVTSVFQRFLTLWNEYSGMLNRTKQITVDYPDGTSKKFSYRFSDFNVIIPITNVNGQRIDMSILEALQTQLKAAFWKGCWTFTRDKLASRVNILGDPTAYIKKSPIGVAWQDDPWENPFLAPDIKKTISEAEPIYVNMADASAVLTKQNVTSPFVRSTDVIAAPDVVARFSRSIRTPGGGYSSPREMDDEKKSGLVPLLALAAGVGAYIYFQGK